MSGEARENNDGCDDGTKEPQNYLQVDAFKGSALSSITPRTLGTLEPVRVENTPFDIGLPSTPPLQSLKMPELLILEEGYNSGS